MTENIPLIEIELNKLIRPGKNILSVSRDLYHIARNLAEIYNDDYLKAIEVNYFAQQVKYPYPYAQEELSAMPYIVAAICADYASGTWDITHS